MKSLKSLQALSLLVAAGAWGVLATDVAAQTIDYSAGQADLTFFYNPDSDTWQTAFRVKGSTVATYSQDPMPTAVGGPGWNDITADDYLFDTLNVILNAPESRTVDSRSWLTTTLSNPAVVDPGIRTRMDNGTMVDNEVTMELDLAASSLPTGASFAMFVEEIGGPVFRFDTANNVLASQWPERGHSHWYWAFSDPGDYTLTFDIFGTRDIDDQLSSVGSATLHFQVIPEPSTVAMVFGILVLGLVFLRRRYS